ncbi:hypothetical protein SKAU_G00043330 [Synaphobranchus kaupii]|uniref:Uncharacterized protein n=1 Tax=Synaphobranchus kaupii TaxID=118154 RepID=A0A9Q1G2F0_SYNKA|nr:hypothetical protein SKAU_G00043330 [Synaphobranchus kaupii]
MKRACLRFCSEAWTRVPEAAPVTPSPPALHLSVFFFVFPESSASLFGFTSVPSRGGAHPGSSRDLAQMDAGARAVMEAIM